MNSVGIDISKGRSTVVVMRPFGEVVISPFEVRHTYSELNKKAYVRIEDWRNRPSQGGHYPYVYVDGIYLRRNWGGEYENVAVLVAIAVNEDGFREVLGADNVQ